MARTAAKAASVEERRAARAAQKKYGKASLQKLKGKKFKPSAVRKRPQVKADANGVPITGGIASDDADASGEKKTRAKPNWSATTRQKRAINREIKTSYKKSAMPYRTFKRMVKGMLPGGYLLSDNAVMALLEVAEAHASEALECARYVAETMGQKTVRRPHLQAVAAITNKMQTPTPLPHVIEETLATPTDLGIMPAGVRTAPVATTAAEPTVEIGGGDESSNGAAEIAEEDEEEHMEQDEDTQEQ